MGVGESDMDYLASDANVFLGDRFFQEAVDEEGWRRTGDEPRKRSRE